MKRGDLVKLSSMGSEKIGKVIEYFHDDHPQKCTLMLKCEDTAKIFYCAALDCVVVCEGEPAEIVRLAEKNVVKCPDKLSVESVDCDESF
jgi:hypothetical protein